MKNLLKNKLTLNTINWIVLYVILVLIVFLISDFNWAVKLSTALIIPAIPPVYIHFWLFNKFFLSRRYYKYAAYSIILLLVTGFGFEYLFKVLINNSETHISGIFTIGFLIITSTALKYFKTGLIDKYRLQEIEFKQLQTELSLLKTQINPHFFFNTLNNLYAMSLRKSDAMPDFILKLSDMMRYVLTTSKEKNVPLSNELEFIKNYISLETIRLENNIDIQINIPADKFSHKISPMILIPFVENSFKHGVGISPDESFIHLDIHIKEDELIFSLENSKLIDNLRVENNTGVGLPNVKRRLALLYPSEHHLVITETDNKYKIELKLKLCQ